MKSVKKAEPHKVLADEAPERIKDKLQQPGVFPLLKLNLRHDGRKFLDLVEMLVDCIVGIVQ